jgi:hypothetical protein
MGEAEICPIDSGTTNIILRQTRYFQTLNKKSGNIMTIAESNAHIVSTGSATLVLSWVPKICGGYTPFIAIGLVLHVYKSYWGICCDESHIISKKIWHDQLGHPELGIMRGIINNSTGHRNFPNPEDFICTVCAKGKLVTRPSLLKIRDEPHKMA